MTRLRTYPPNQSPLYKLGSKARLASILGLASVRELTGLARDADASYRTFVEGGRTIQVPSGALLGCHKQLARLFARIEVPNYVHATKGRSYVTNAATHAMAVPVVKTDISKYFPSTTFNHVHRLFVEDLKCSADVSWHLAKLCTVNGHLPTGSQISTPLAFLANRPLFERINVLATSEGCVMTSYVDDIVISGKSASTKLLNAVVMQIRRWGLRASNKPNKTMTYPAAAPKLITGVVVRSTSLALPNNRRKKIEDALATATSKGPKENREAALKELAGRLNEASQVDASAVRPRHRRPLKRGV